MSSLANSSLLLKVWKVKDGLLHLLQKTKEHMKYVTSLAISEPGDRLYSGSLDRTVKVIYAAVTVISMSCSLLNNSCLLLNTRSGLLKRQQYVMYRNMI